MRRLLVAVACGLAVVCGAQLAYAQEATSKRMSFYEGRGRLTVSLKFSELFDARAFERLSSGFPTTVVVRGWVYRKGQDLPVSFTLASFRVVYDLWDEVYVVRKDGPDGRTTRRLRRRSEVLSSITTLSRFAIARLEQVAVGPHHYLGLVVELNPVSEELLAETRRWLSRPAGKGRLDVSSSFFGSFVSVFVNPKLREADRVLRYRSQPFYRVAGR